MATVDLRPGEVYPDVAVVAGLIKAQFPQWAELPVTPVAAPGMDNTTYRLGNDMSVRLPRFQSKVRQVAREQRWLPYLGPKLPLAVPQPLALGVPGEGFPFPFSVYRWLDGENADFGLIADPRQAVIDLAGFIAALQRIDAAGGPPPEESNDFRGVDLGDMQNPAAVEWSASVHARIVALDGLGVDTSALAAVYETALAAPRWSGPPVWIHGDPAPANMLVKDGRLSAVIDFGTLGVGDPACDMIGAWQFLDAGSRELFRASLSVDDASWARGRGWGLTGILPSPEDLAIPERAAQDRRRLDEIVADHQRSR